MNADIMVAMRMTRRHRHTAWESSKRALVRRGHCPVSMVPQDDCGHCRKYN